jgi:hypothetical protein
VDGAETADAAPAQRPGPPAEPALEARLEAELKEYGKLV